MQRYMMSPILFILFNLYIVDIDVNKRKGIGDIKLGKDRRYGY